MAIDSFKDSLSSVQAINIIAEAALKVMPHLEILKVPIADGGEGTVEALVMACNGRYHQVIVRNPLGRDVEAKLGIIHSDTAIIEMAQASGLTLLKNEERNPLITSSYGTGQLIKAALDLGYRKLLIGIGGSATNDGGVGAITALGGQFIDENGYEVICGGDLKKIVNIDLNNLDYRLQESSISVICDVTNPLCGEFGATFVYGPQKGATPQMLLDLEEGMKNLADLIAKKMGIDAFSLKSGGAAGGIGAALQIFCGGLVKPGIDTILDIVHFDKLLEGVSLVISGEGRLDSQSLYGKAPLGIARRCVNRHIPVVLLVGAMGENIDKIYDMGVTTLFSIIKEPITLNEAIKQSQKLLSDAGERLFRFIKLFKN